MESSTSSPHTLHIPSTHLEAWLGTQGYLYNTDAQQTVVIIKDDLGFWLLLPVSLVLRLWVLAVLYCAGNLIQGLKCVRQTLLVRELHPQLSFITLLPVLSNNVKTVLRDPCGLGQVRKSP